MIYYILIYIYIHILYILYIYGIYCIFVTTWYCDIPCFPAWRRWTCRNAASDPRILEMGSSQNAVGNSKI